MTTEKDLIEKLFATFNSDKITGIEKLPKSGGDRIYFRIETEQLKYIATCNQNIKENNTFFYFSKHFKTVGAPVPHILAINADDTIYIQEDLGTDCLLDILEKKGFTDSTKELYKKTLKALVHLQIKGDESLNYDECITSKEFGKQAILSDLLYFKYYFLDTLKIPYDKE